MINKGLSFIIPTLNEEKHIGGVLDSIKQNLAGTSISYEVIVVDNCSTDKTAEIAMRRGAICHKISGCSISSLRNFGALMSKFDILVFLDGDVYLGKGWGDRIAQVMEKLNMHPNIITGSFCGVSDENNWIERIWFAPRTSLRDVNYMNSGHFIICKMLFSKIEGYNPYLTTGEDYEICIRAKKNGALIENDPDLNVVHAGYPKNLKNFFARERWHGYGDFVSFNALLSSKPALATLANFFLLVICSLGAVIYPQLWFIFPCVYVLSLAVLAIAASINRCRGKLNTDFMGIVFLYMVYFTARTASLVDAAIQSPIIRRYARV